MGKISIRINSISLEGELGLPKHAKSIVLFAHGSGNSRLSPRNTFVANVLQKENIAALLIDLLTKQEDEVYEARFDINLLTQRLIKITQWLKKQPETKDLSIGLFGASTGAAAALRAAARLGAMIGAVVSRGGRPDLTMDILDKVISPTLLIVGENDYEVIKMNESAYSQLRCTKKLEVVKGATHLFEESGKLEEVSKLSTYWFKKYL